MDHKESSVVREALRGGGGGAWTILYVLWETAVTSAPLSSLKVTFCLVCLPTTISVNQAISPAADDAMASRNIVSRFDSSTFLTLDRHWEL